VSEAIAAYEQAIAADPNSADAHYNVARLLEQSGKPEIAVRHLLIYRQLTRRK
jgi:thioredoxin-like negative regulator of GroEL